MHPKNILFQKGEIKQFTVKTIPVNCYVASKIYVIVTEREIFHKRQIAKNKNVYANKNPD